MTELYRFERALVEFSEEISVDGYMEPDGSFRVGITTASLAAGFAENYLRRQLGKSGTRFKGFAGEGFGYPEVLSVRDTLAGERAERTITIREFIKLLRWADRSGNDQAGVILDAFAETSVKDFFLDAFGYCAQTIEQKRATFYEAYARGMDDLEWKQMDYEDVQDLALPGDEDHLQYGQWNWG